MLRPACECVATFLSRTSLSANLSGRRPEKNKAFDLNGNRDDGAKEERRKRNIMQIIIAKN